MPGPGAGDARGCPKKGSAQPGLRWWLRACRAGLELVVAPHRAKQDPRGSPAENGCPDILLSSWRRPGSRTSERAGKGGVDFGEGEGSKRRAGSKKAGFTARCQSLPHPDCVSAQALLIELISWDEQLPKPGDVFMAGACRWQL